jgi:hypothetical protein
MKTAIKMSNFFYMQHTRNIKFCCLEKFKLETFIQNVGWDIFPCWALAVAPTYQRHKLLFQGDGTLENTEGK